MYSFVLYTTLFPLYKTFTFITEKLDRLCDVGPIPQLLAYFKLLLPELVASNIRELVTSVSHETFVASVNRLYSEIFVASVGHFRYIGLLLLLLVAFTLWNFDYFR